MEKDIVIIFHKKIRLKISCELFAWETIHM